MNAVVPLPRAATPAALTRGGKSAGLRLAEQRDAEQHDYRLQDRFGYHPVHALAIREIRFDRAEAYRRPGARPGLRANTVKMLTCSGPPAGGPVWFSASKPSTRLFRVRRTTTWLALRTPDRLLTRGSESLESIRRKRDATVDIAGARGAPDRCLAPIRRVEPPAPPYCAIIAGGKRWGIEHPDRMLVDPDDSGTPPIGMHYAG